MSTIMDRYQKWLNADIGDDLKNELKTYSQAQIEDAFFRTLEFGTAGMRGVLGPGSNRLNVYVVKKATIGFAKYLLKHYPDAKERGVVIAHDNRLFSREFAEESARVLSLSGLNAYLFDSLRPTPELSFAVRELKAVGGIMITASHNPKEYNGYKVYDHNGCQLIPELITDLVSIIESLPDELDCQIEEVKDHGKIEILSSEIDDKFVKNVESIALNPDLDKSKIKIVFSPQHGTSYVNAMRVFNDLKYNVIEVKEQCSPDPLFSNTISPNPEEPSAYELALKYAKDNDADLIVTTDPDADRIGIAFKDSTGKYVLYTGNQTGALLIEYIFSQRKEKGLLSKNGVMFNTIVTSSLGAKIAESYGVSVESLLTGFKFIGDRIHHYEMNKEKTFEFGYEESYGYLIKPFARDKDALQALLMIAEMTNYYLLRGLRLDQVYDQLQEKFSYYNDQLFSIYFKGMKGLEVMKGIMKELRVHPLTVINSTKVIASEDYLSLERTENSNKTKINLPSSDVIKLFLEDGSTIAIRPSGTEPKCKFYYGAVGKTKEEVASKPATLHQEMIRLLKIEN